MKKTGYARLFQSNFFLWCLLYTLEEVCLPGHLEERTQGACTV
jgi:hypothetical protein